ncbi:MAG: TRAP transporter small permease [Beijerinckiaceae bacterium]|jgi:TRAP-type C4-dicarboxylate transport system permease small subunit|nr:TRAP transporter small permease [Beijerinckiaceae bacterium]
MAKLSRLLDSALRVGAVLLMFALLACVVIGVAMRAVNNPVAWSDETAQYLLVWTGFIGWMIATRRRSHIRITVLLDGLPRAGKKLAETVIQLAIIGLALALLRWGWPLIGRNWDIEWVSLPLPAGLIYLPIPLLALVVAAQALLAILAVWRDENLDQPTEGGQVL